MTTKDVLMYAKTIADHPRSGDSCAQYCLRCVLAEAKSALDERDGTGLCLLNVFEDISRDLAGLGMREREGDRVLIEARDAIAHYEEIPASSERFSTILDEVLSQYECLDITQATPPDYY